MSFAFDDGFASTRLEAKSDWIEPKQRVDFSRRPRDAERIHRQIIETIEAAETLAILDDYMARESIVIDALWMARPEYAALIDAAAETQRALLRYVPRPAEPDNATAQEGHGNQKVTTMSFQFDAGAGGGSQGPWIAWSSLGTQDGAVPPKSFFVRDENGKTPFAGFAQGVILDIVKMKTGWQKSEGMAGVAPEWQWNASMAQMQPQPGEDWKKGFSIPCAIGGGKTATWEQAGAGSWNAFVDLVPALQQGPGDGSLPLVRLTGVRFEKYKKGGTNIPVLEILKWVPRPDCLKEGFVAATEPAAQATQPARQQAQAVQQPAPAQVDESIAF